MKLRTFSYLVIAAPIIFGLSACGARGDLEPKLGNNLPVKAYAQTQEQSAERLLRTNPQARPNREAEILSRSTIRSEDPFDLPPEGDLADIPVDSQDIPADLVPNDVGVTQQPEK